MTSSIKDIFIIDEITKDLLCIAREGSKAAEMLRTVSNNMKEWSVGKSNRWIGYSQCLLVAEGAITLDECMHKTRLITKAACELDE